MDIKTIGVVGCGTMGSGIAQVAACSGLDVILSDVTDDLLKRSVAGIDKSLSKLIEKGKLAGPKEALLGRIKTTTRLEDMKAAQFAVEAVTEDFEVKKKVLLELDRVLAPEVILASNTSSISITRLGALTKRAGRLKQPAG